jgi:parallel beta-helix repeat protein
MTTKAVAAALALAALGALALFSNPTLTLAADPGGVDTVRVATPTGVRDADRSSVLAALQEVQPGGTVQFAPGTYLMGGEIIRVTVPRITLLGHPEGTTLRGCDPGEFPWEDVTEFGNNCNAIELAAGQQTVRNSHLRARVLGTPRRVLLGRAGNARGRRRAPHRGQHLPELLERGARAWLLVRADRHPEQSVPQQLALRRDLRQARSTCSTTTFPCRSRRRCSYSGSPWTASTSLGRFDLHESVEGVGRTCENNVVAGNRIDGVTEGIMVTANEPGIICRNNVIRDNTIAVRRAHPPTMPGFIPVHDEADSTVVGVPLALRGVAGESTLEDNLIEGNIIVGAEGLGIEVRNASRNRIVNNTVTRVVRREPFPGNAFTALPILGGAPDAWRDANGSAIWLSLGSEENEVIDNSFGDVAACAVYLSGNRNVVETRTASDAVCDLGTGNQVRGPSGAEPRNQR